MELDINGANTIPEFGEMWKQENFACYWCIPLRVKDETKGARKIFRRTNFTPDKEWFEFLEALAGQAAIAIDRTQLFENLQRADLDLNLAYDATLEVGRGQWIFVIMKLKVIPCEFQN